MAVGIFTMGRGGGGGGGSGEDTASFLAMSFCISFMGF